MDAFMVSTAPEIEFRSTGSVHEDFRRQLRSVVRVLTSQRGRLIATLIGGAQGDPELKEAYRTRWQSKRRAESCRMLQLAISRGEVRKDIDCELEMDVLYGPLYYRLLINHALLTSGYAEELANVVLSGIKT